MGRRRAVWRRTTSGKSAYMKHIPTYAAPVIERLGGVAELTEQSGLHNADNPTGVNDAYSNY